MKVVIDVDEWIADMESSKYKVNDSPYAKGCNDVLDYHIKKLERIKAEAREAFKALKSEFQTEDINMTKYEVIKRIMNSNSVDENDKVYHIEMFLKGWLAEEDLTWIWK